MILSGVVCAVSDYPESCNFSYHVLQFCVESLLISSYSCYISVTFPIKFQ